MNAVLGLINNTIDDKLDLGNLFNFIIYNLSKSNIYVLHSYFYFLFFDKIFLQAHSKFKTHTIVCVS